MTTIVGFFVALTSDLFKTAAAVVAVAWLCLALSCLLVLFVVQERALGRRARYASALISLHHCLHAIRDGWVGYQKGQMLGPYRQAFAEAMNFLAVTFTTATGVPCRACVKFLSFNESEDPRDFTTATFCRSGQEQADLAQIQRLTENSDFYDLVTSDDPYFFGNDLRNVPGYRNANVRPGAPKREWPYLAAIVWPIRAQRNLDPNAIGPDRSRVIGYLCIDSKTPNVFDEDFDVQLGTGVADILYAFLDPIQSQSRSDREVSRGS